VQQPTPAFVGAIVGDLVGGVLSFVGLPVGGVLVGLGVGHVPHNTLQTSFAGPVPL